MMTVKEVLRYCENRAGVRFDGRMFTPIGGGLYHFEKTAAQHGLHEESAIHRASRIELQSLMLELHGK